MMSFKHAGVSVQPLNTESMHGLDRVTVVYIHVFSLNYDIDDTKIRMQWHDFPLLSMIFQVIETGTETDIGYFN
jgi:hypothetical protein